ncbi:MAG: hypothetical protein J6Z31_07030 [Fibrobacter sp.]|nr:hypothetical protein [Fibrobacter sp.]
MKKTIFALLTMAIACALTACGPSALEIKEMSSDCDFNVEIRYVPNDSIAIFMGNAIYVATSQLVSGNLYPLSISTRTDIDSRAPTDVVNSDEEFAAYINRRVPGVSHFGIVIDENSGNEIGFEKSSAIQMFDNFFSKAYPGSNVVYFDSRNGSLVSAKKLH